MGYEIRQGETSFFISKDHTEEALDAIHALAKKGKRFMWVENDEVLESSDIDAALWCWRWQSVYDDKDNIVDLEFEGEKGGDDDVLFGAIARFVRPGSFIQMSGVDGAVWRWVFKDNTCIEVKPTWP